MCKLTYNRLFHQAYQLEQPKPDTPSVKTKWFLPKSRDIMQSQILEGIPLLPSLIA